MFAIGIRSFRPDQELVRLENMVQAGGSSEEMSSHNDDYMCIHMLTHTRYHVTKPESGMTLIRYLRCPSDATQVHVVESHSGRPSLANGWARRAFESHARTQAQMGGCWVGLNVGGWVVGWLGGFECWWLGGWVGLNVGGWVVGGWVVGWLDGWMGLNVGWLGGWVVG